MADGTTSHMDEKIQAMAAQLSKALDANMRQANLPSFEKQLRTFTATEAAELVGVSDGHLRKQFFLDKANENDVVVDARGKRSYTAASIDRMREIIAQDARAKHLKYVVPRRRDGEQMQVISVANFKGGSGKTTSAIHLAQKLALDGYRVLAVDLDPQASLTTFFGIRPEIDLTESGTIYDALRYDDPLPFSSVLRKTYFHNLDLAPGGLMLSEFETTTAVALTENRQPPFFRRLDLCLKSVDADYDVVIIDCPPQLGFTTLAALMASTGVLVTVVANMLDVASMAQFLRMSGDLLATIAEHGVRPRWSFFKLLLTRFEPHEAPSKDMETFLRSLFGRDVLTATFLKSSAVIDAGIQQKTIFEIRRSEVNRQTYDRSVESINAVVSEVEGLMAEIWGREAI